MSGPLRLVPGPVPDPSRPAATPPTSVFTGQGRVRDHKAGDDGGRHQRAPRPAPSWADDPLDDLVERLADVCAAAVHPDEIAAFLEADGLTGEQITARYGRRNVFELATELYERVPRGFPEPPARSDPWHAKPGRFLLRGVVFTLPGLGYVLSTPFLEGPTGLFGLSAGTGPLAASALVGWAWNQALAHRAYRWLALGGSPAAAACLRIGGTLGAVLAFAAALVLPGPGAAMAFAAGQSVYLAAATALLVLGKERELLYSLLPIGVGSTVLLWIDLPSVVRAALPLATVLAALSAAALAITRAIAERPKATADGEEKNRKSAGPRWHESVPYGLFGLGCAVLTSVAVLGDVLRYGAGASLTGPSVIALTLSMGVAEWLLYRCRGLALAALAESTTAGALLLRAAWVLARCMAVYLSVLAVLVYTTAALWPDGPHLGPQRLAAVVALGAVMWTGLLLQAFGTAWIPALSTLAAAVVETVPLALHAWTPTSVQLAACCCTAAVLLGAATALLGRITAHR
ncbi:hypothetical protein [Streptomyces zagrosensis]|uniref:Integral membrane protein n=1 Tax=Streptomyces zagrosensis TaxID=1042984 RepID=A0A7W9V096_9ACTN|nr:hypothetical protein [Streptomyces zagrosensis]MBB5937905.1 hypothetical protein [Streptomyces zagrosensis]